MKKILLVLSLLFALAACQVARAAPNDGRVTTRDAASATYKIVAYDRNPFEGGEGQWSGTAWKLSDTYMVTAGHVCHPHLGFPPVFRVQNVGGQSWPVAVVKYELDDEKDLCLLRASVPGESLPLAIEPAFDQAVFYTGAPHGIWGDGVRPVYHGHYAGGNVVIIGGAPGASGSAVLTEHGVMGVLVAGIESGNIIFVVSVSDLRDFLKGT